MCLLAGEVRVVKDVSVFKEFLAMVACEEDDRLFFIGEVFEEMAKELIHVMDGVVIPI